MHCGKKLPKGDLSKCSKAGFFVGRIERGFDFLGYISAAQDQ